MKKIFLLLFLITLITQVSLAQTYYFRPNAAAGKDCYVNTSQTYINTNFGTNQSLIIGDAPVNGINSWYRSVIQFDLTSLPSGFLVLSAELSLYNDNTSGINGGQHSIAGGSNSFHVARMGTVWDESTFTAGGSYGWTLLNATPVLASTNNNQNYLNINVMSLVQGWLDDPSTNKGFMLTLQNTTISPSRYVVLASSDHPDSTKRPKLVITLGGPTCVANITAGGPTTICPGGSVLLTANYGNTYSWWRNNIYMSGVHTSTYNATQSGTYTVAVYQTNGCSVVSSGVTVTQVLDGAGITVNGSSTSPICIGSGITLNATTGSGYTFQWKLNGANIPGATSASYSTSITGTYTCQITSGACSILSNSIVAQQTGVATITAGGPTTFCPGGSVILTASSGTAYQWKKNNVNISGAISPTYLATTSGGYSVMVTSLGGCTAVSSSVAVTKVLEGAGITVNGSSSSPVCIGSGITLNASTGSGYTFQWKLNGANIPGATSASYSTSITGTYTCQITSGTCSLLSNSIVAQQSVPATITANGALTFCAGGNVFLVASAGSAFQWKKNNVNIPGATLSVYTATLTGAYTVQITQSSGCTALSQSVGITQVLEGVAITANGSTTSPICMNGTAITLNATFGTAYSYQWKKNGSVIPGATSSSYTPTVSGTYTCQFTSGSCTTTPASIIIQSLTATLNVNGSPNYCTNPPLLSVSTTSGNGTLTYQWKRDGINIPGATTSQHTPINNGSYACIVASTGACGTVTTNSVNIQSGVVPDIEITGPGGVFNQVSICNNQPVDLTVSYSNGSSYNFNDGIPNWYFNGNYIGSNTSISVSASGDYYAVVNTSCGMAYTHDFAILNLNSASIAVSGVCQPTLSVIIGNYTFLNYVWRRNGVVIPGWEGIVAVDTGNYTCEITNACGSIVLGPVYIAPGIINPVITPSSPVTNCGGNVAFSSNTGTGITHQWYKNSVAIPGAVNLTYNANSTGNYYVKVTSTNGCTALSNQTSITVTPPTPTITGNNLICSGTGTYLTNINPYGQTYQWKKSGVNITGAFGPSYYVTLAGAYSCQVTNACGSSLSNTINVTVVTGPPAKPGSITTVGGNANVCPGTVKSYSIASVANASTYTWTPPPGGTVTSGQGTTAVTITYLSGFLANDSLRVKAINSCGASSNRALSIKRNNPATPGTITGQTFGVCSGTALPYSVTNVAGITYNWSLATGHGNIASGQGTNAVTVNYGSGVFTDSLRVTATNGCGTSAVRKLAIKSVPGTPVAITGTATVCANQQGVPYSIAPVAGTVNYTWTGPTGSHISDGTVTSAGNTLITTASSVTVNYATSAGTVKVRGNNSCGSGSYRSLTITINCRTADATPGDFHAQINPNPTEGEFFINLENAAPGMNMVTLRDSKGMEVFRNEFDSNEIYFEDKNLAPGIYFVEVRNARGVDVVRVVKY